MSQPIVPAEPDAVPKRNPPKVPAWVAVLVLVGVGGGAVYGGWQLIKPPPAVDLSQYESNDVRRRPAIVVPPPVADGVTIKPDGSGTVQTRGFGVQFLAGAKPTLVARSPASPSIEDRPTLRARNVALNNADARKAAGVSDQQLAKLRTLDAAQPPAVDAADRTALLALWSKLRAADAASKPAAEKSVLDAVKDVAAKHATASAAAYHTLAEQVRGVLSPDQVAKLRAAK